MSPLIQRETEDWELEFIRTGNESLIPEDKREAVIEDLKLLYSLTLKVLQRDEFKNKI